MKSDTPIVNYLRFIAVFVLFSQLLSARTSAERKNRKELQNQLEMCRVAGSSVACARAGALLLKGGKLKEAEKYFKRACLSLVRPVGAACYFWGIYSKGREKKLRAFLKACKLGDPDGCTFFGDLVRAKTPQRARRAYRFGCKFGDGRACFSLWKMENKKLSRELERSCKLSYPMGCLKLGEIYLKMGKKSLAVRAFERVCSVLSARACYAIIKKNNQNLPVIAKEILRRNSCKKGFKKACRQKIRK